MLILAWVLLVGLGIVLPFAVSSVTMAHGFRQGWQGIPVYLGLAGALGRGASIKVILHEETLTVVNYFRTYNIPANAIRDVEVDNNGNLRIYLHKELRLRTLGRMSNVYVTAFAGSLMDHFRGTSDKTKQTIREWLSFARTPGGEHAAVQVSWTWCRYADAALILCAITIGAGALWMALTAH